MRKDKETNNHGKSTHSVQSIHVKARAGFNGIIKTCSYVKFRFIILQCSHYNYVTLGWMIV